LQHVAWRDRDPPSFFFRVSISKSETSSSGFFPPATSVASSVGDDARRLNHRAWRAGDERRSARGRRACLSGVSPAKTPVDRFAGRISGRKEHARATAAKGGLGGGLRPRSEHMVRPSRMARGSLLSRRRPGERCQLPRGNWTTPLDHALAWGMPSCHVATGPRPRLGHAQGGLTVPAVGLRHERARDDDLRRARGTSQEQPTNSSRTNAKGQSVDAGATARSWWTVPSPCGRRPTASQACRAKRVSVTGTA